MSVVIKQKAIKYRAYPSDEQKNLFARTFGCCRKVWNLMLSDKTDYYKEHNKMLQTTPAMYKDEYPFLREVDSLALANVQLQLQKSFKSFFEKNVGYPKFKSKKHEKCSYTTNNQHGTINVLENGIRLPKVGIVKANIHREAPCDWLLKSATVSMNHDGTYYISVLYEYETEIEALDTSKPFSAVGLDYKSDGLYADSNGNIGSNHKFYRESHEKLAKAQRKLSRKVGSKKHAKKSNNYLKQQRKVAKIHRHIANQRLDNLHKLSIEIANQYDVVCVETLNMKAIANKRSKLGKATLDNGYGEFLSMLEYKLADRGKILVKIDKWYPSSQRCHECGAIHPEMKDKTIRTMDCDCGNHVDRDLNAALNILDEGLRILAS